MIPTEIYINLLIILIVLLILIGLYAYFYKGIDTISRTLIIWYLIILIINIANIISVYKFYEKNKNRKGEKGTSGDKGPRGFRGDNQMCSSCGDTGLSTEVYGSVINDLGEKVNNTNVKEGKCIFPFSHNYVYNSKCIKNSAPPGSDKNDASVFGWCATEVDSNREPKKYAYCNANSSIQEKQRKEADLRRQRKEFVQNNSGILDIKIVAENTTKKAREACEAKNGFEFYDKDLNAGTDGKFVHMCLKKGIGGNGVSGLIVKKYSKEEVVKPTINENNIQYVLIDTDLNKDSGDGTNTNRLYMYKQMGNKNYIKDIVALNENGGQDTCKSIGEDYHLPDNCNEAYCGDLNYGTHIAGVNKLQLCVSNTSSNILPIDTAFVYKDGKLYIFRGPNFYKMKSNPVGGSITAEPKYPKNIGMKWGKQKGSSADVKSCESLSKSKKMCGNATNCTYDDEYKKCEDIANYDAAFTYGYNQKTYFFKGGKVFIYNDKQMKMTADSPKNISEVFPGVPNNITSVFTWAKDSKTYFFKGPFYYKYDDKNKKIEKGYPKRTNRRWKNMPNLINAIFSLPFNMQAGLKIGNQSTYVISGNESWYIDPSNDELKDKKTVNERFNGVDIINELNPIPTN